jgi:hypothetical protein
MFIIINGVVEMKEALGEEKLRTGRPFFRGTFHSAHFGTLLLALVYSKVETLTHCFRSQNFSQAK